MLNDNLTVLVKSSDLDRVLADYLESCFDVVAACLEHPVQAIRSVDFPSYE